MALLPTGYVVGTNGVYNVSPTEQIGGAAFGITDATTVTAGKPLTYVMPIKDNVGKIGNGRSLPIALSGVNHVYATQKTVSAGTFAYETYSPVIRTVSTTLNGIANTALLINGNSGSRLRRSLVQKSRGIGYGTAFRAGYFRFTKIAGQRNNWSVAPSALNATFKSTTSNSTDSDDQALYVTYRSIPGELVYMHGSLDPKQDDYKAKTA